ncbi:hypothetical protein DL96DRAFT_1618513 [Flagelloscypha sp. PMI_526]|nr:hypothetical protein DL96DRAFT_1618513 [Flagelloscypha sp. PMI_526]
MKARPPPAIRHSNLYFNDKFIVLQVEDTLFRVKTAVLSEHSEVFADMFSIPKPSSSAGEGDDDENPIWIEGESADRFAQALSWMITTDHSSIKKSRDEWKELFLFSRKWIIPTLESAALNALQLDFEWQQFEKVLFAYKHNIPMTFATSDFRAMLCNTNPLTLQDARALPLQVFVIVTQIREIAAMYSCRGGTHPYKRTYPDCDCFPAMETVRKWITNLGSEDHGPTRSEAIAAAQNIVGI